ncbi:MAG: gliding motility lipoprotein GldH [Bacteroidales bacterium]
MEISQMTTDRKKRNNNNTRKRIRGVLCTLFSFVLFSCLEKDAYSQFHAIKNMEWGTKDTLTFQSQLTDTLRNYLIELEIRKDVKYPYRDLWLEIAIQQDSVIQRCDTLHLFLSDKHGRPMGTGFGTLYQQSDTLGQNFMPDNSHPYLIKVRHLMSDDFLYGISDVGIRISKK